MSAALADVLYTDPQFLLAQAREQARQAGLAFAGALSPRQAWQLVQQRLCALRWRFITPPKKSTDWWPCCIA